MAAMHGEDAIVKAIAQVEGAKLDAKDKYGDTALIWACRNCHSLCVQALVAAKADVKVEGKFGDTALHWAAKRDQQDICKVTSCPCCLVLN